MNCPNNKSRATPAKHPQSLSWKIRQQDPVTKLWSLCEIRSFSSNGGAKTSIWIQWSEVDVSYEVPSA